MSEVGGNDAGGSQSARTVSRRTDGELILLWTLPAALILWIASFFLFPGFNPPMSPTMPAEQVAAFYRDPAHIPQIRSSMILFNWFGVCLVPILALIVLQIRRMAHRTPIFSYAMLGCAAGGPTLFLVANVCWLLAAFRPERSPELTQLLNDLGWITFTILVPFFIGQCVILALAIYFDDPSRPVFNRWVAYFNLRRGGRAGARVIRRRLVDRTAGLGRLAVVLGEEHCHCRLDHRDGRCPGPGRLSRACREPRAPRRTGHRMSAVITPPTSPATPPAGPLHHRIGWHLRRDPKRELWLAWGMLMVFYGLFFPMFFIVAQVQPPPEPTWDLATQVHWFAERHLGIPVGFGVIFAISGMIAVNNALIAYSMRRMSVSRAFAYSYLLIYSLSAVPGMLLLNIALIVGTLRPDRDPRSDRLAL